MQGGKHLHSLIRQEILTVQGQHLPCFHHTALQATQFIGKLFGLCFVKVAIGLLSGFAAAKKITHGVARNFCTRPYAHARQGDIAFQCAGLDAVATVQLCAGEERLAGATAQPRDLAAREQHWLIENFGKSYGAWLFDAAWGRDDRPIETESEPVSMSRETTFERDLHAVRDRAELGAVFTRLCEQVAADLQRKGYEGKTIGIKLRYDNFQAVTRDQSLPGYTADAKQIRQIAGQCLKRVDLSRRVRLLGVRVGSLVKAGTAPATISHPVAAEEQGHGPQAQLLFTDD